jgi:hypothetical protein
MAFPPACLPEPAAGAQKWVERVAEMGLTQLRTTQRGCFRQNAFHPGKKELDPVRSTQASIDYALPIFQARASELWKVRTEHEGLKGWLALLRNEVLVEVKGKWRGLNWRDQDTFDMVCMPTVEGALDDARDEWLLHSVDRAIKPAPDRRI